MDVIRVLLSFLEKRLHQVGRGTCCVGASLALTFPSSCGPCFFTIYSGKWRSAWQCELGNFYSCSVVRPDRKPDSSSLRNMGIFTHLFEGFPFVGYREFSNKILTFRSLWVF